jgi:hypothetical protein
MTTYEVWSLVAQTIIIAVATATVVVYYRQLRVMGRQLTSMQDSSRSESFLGLIAFLQSSEVHEARRLVRGVLSQKPLQEWSTKDREAASKVVSNYDVAAALLRSGFLPLDLVTDNWGPSIIHCYTVLDPYIKEQRSRSGGHEKYWANFQWLREQCS